MESLNKSASTSESKLGLYEIVFVEEEKESNAFKTAYKEASSSEYDLDPVKMSVQDCLELDASLLADKVFIMSSFSSQGFKELKNMGCVILGPVALLSCLKKGSLVRREEPPFNLIMRTCIVTFSGLSPKLKEDLKKKITYMGGQVNKCMTNRVTHLITESTVSEKYFIASDMKMPCMLPSWVDEMLKDDALYPNEFNDPMYDKFKMPIFYGLIISVSGLEGDTRKNVASSIRINGGTYSGDLKKNYVTHLVVEKPTGIKYNTAIEWKVKCVSPDWIYKSIEMGYALKEEPFTISAQFKKPSSSTPTKPGDSNIAESVMEISKVSLCTTLHTTRSHQMNDTNLTIEPVGDETLSATLDDEVMDLLENFDISKIKPNNNLDGYQILPLGFSNLQCLSKIHKIISCGGGIRCEKIGSRVTHVVLRSNKEQHLKSVPKDFAGQIVNVKWLLTALNTSKEFPVEQFLISKPKSHETESVDSLNSKSKSRENGHKDESHVSMQSTKSGSDLKESENKSERHVLVESLKSELEQKSEFEEPVDSPKIEENLESTLFTGMIFSIDEFDEEHTNKVKKIIIENGGKISYKSSNVIIPPIAFKSDRKAKEQLEYISSCWVQSCIEKGELLNQDNFFLYKPILIADSVKTTQPLKNCVFTLSQFGVCEKEALTTLIKFLGGVVQDYFSKKPVPDKGIQTNSHLILQEPSGNKFKAARLWKIKVMKAGWLNEIAKHGKYVDETEFILDASCTSESNKKSTSNSHSTHLKNDENNGCAVMETKLSKENFKTPSRIKNVNDRVLIETPDSNFKPSQVRLNHRLFGTDADNLEDSFRTTISKNLNKTICVDKISLTETNPFKSVTIYVSTKLKDLKNELSKIANSLGANYRDTYNYLVTHVIHEGRASERLPQDVKLSKNSNCKIVSPEWLYECQRKNTFIDETEFPHTYNKRLSLSSYITIQKVSNSTHSQSDPTLMDTSQVNTSNISAVASCRASDNTTATKTVTLEKAKSASGANTQAMDQHIKALVSVTEAAKKESEMIKLRSETSSRTPSNERRHRTFAKIETQPVEVDQLQPSQECRNPIVWSDNENNPNTVDYSETPSLTGHSFGLIVCVPKVFLFSSIQNDDEFQSITSQVEKLGGKVITGNNFDSSATHIVVNKLGKSEKMLSAIASGMIVIHKAYISDSEIAQRFLEEDSYILGSDSYIEKYKIQEAQASQMKAVYRWHKHYLSTGEGAFGDWCVLLLVCSKKEIYSRVLKAGGATVVESPKDMVLSKRRIALCDMGKLKQDVTDYKELMKQQIVCLKPEYFSAFLYSFPEPDIEDFITEAAKEFTNLLRNYPSKPKRFKFSH